MPKAKDNSTAKPSRGLRLVTIDGETAGAPAPARRPPLTRTYFAPSTLGGDTLLERLEVMEAALRVVNAILAEEIVRQRGTTGGNAT